MRSFIFLLILLASFNANSQSSVYHPFPGTNTVWTYSSWQSGEYSNELNGDTLLNGTMYKRVFESGYYKGGIRESGRVVYIVPDTSTAEYILYDFNIGLGDTILNPFGGAACSGDTAIVDFVDSVLTSDGYHRELFFNSFAVWIEGVGAKHSLLNPCNMACLTPGSPVLQCMLTDSGFSYPPNVATCFASTAETSNKGETITIFPNPVHSNAIVDFANETFSGSFRMYSMQGVLVRMEQFERKTLINIDRSNLPGGIYYLQILNEFGKQRTGKILIE